MDSDHSDDPPDPDALSVLVERFEREVTSDASFERLLYALLAAALRNGVSVEGGWDARNDASLPDYEVLITELHKPPGRP